MLIDSPDENVIATVHLMNKHGLDAEAALDQSSRGANDHGVDAWYYNPGQKELFVYQSKLSDARAIAANGFGDLERAHEWVEMVVVAGQLERNCAAFTKSNASSISFTASYPRVRHDLKRVHFVLLSPINAARPQRMLTTSKRVRKRLAAPSYARSSQSTQAD